MNVSYTEEGLKYTQNNSGKFIYFKNAYVDRTNKDKITFRGELKRNKDYYIEDYVPRNHRNPSAQKQEFLMMNKAYRLLYNNSSILN